MVVDIPTITNENVARKTVWQGKAVNGTFCTVDLLRLHVVERHSAMQGAIGWHDLCPTRIFGEYASEGWWSESNRTTARVARPRRAALLPNSRGRS